MLLKMLFEQYNQHWQFYKIYCVFQCLDLGMGITYIQGMIHNFAHLRYLNQSTHFQGTTYGLQNRGNKRNS